MRVDKDVACDHSANSGRSASNRLPRPGGFMADPLLESSSKIMPRSCDAAVPDQGTCQPATRSGSHQLVVCCLLAYCGSSRSILCLHLRIDERPMEGIPMKYAVLLAILASTTLFMSPASAHEQQVGAMVFNLEEGECNLLWLTPTGAFTRVEGSGTGVVTPSGQASLVCTAEIDFDDPDLATIDQVCAIIPDNCNGNGAITAADRLICSFEGRQQQPLQAIANDGGIRVLVCRFPA